MRAQIVQALAATLLVVAVAVGLMGAASDAKFARYATIDDVFNLPAASTESVVMKLGNARSGNGNSYIDLIGDATYTSYGLRIRREGSGPNSETSISHRGTGALELNSQDTGGTVELQAVGTTYASVGNSVAGFHVEGLGNGAYTTNTGAAEELNCGVGGPYATWTTTSLIPINSRLDFVSVRVLANLTGPTDFDVGDGTTVNIYGDAIATTQNTIAPTASKPYQETWTELQLAAAEVTLTFNGGDCSAGGIRVTAHYRTVTPPTSN